MISLTFSVMVAVYASCLQMILRHATLDINDDGVNLSDKLKCVEKWCSEWQLSTSVKNVQLCLSILATRSRAQNPALL